MTEDQIASIQYAADWLSRSEDIGNRKHGERLRALLSASIADTAGAKPVADSFRDEIEALVDGWNGEGQQDGLSYMSRVEQALHDHPATPPAPSVADAAGANSNSLADSPLVKKYRRDCWLRNHAYERAARTCEAILAFGFVGDESADRFEWTAKECARIVRQLKDHEEFANKHEENDD